VALRLGSTPNTAALPRAWARPIAALQVAAVGCDALVDAEPQALGVTCWFNAASHGEPYLVTVRFTGHRLGVRGKHGSSDRRLGMRRVPNQLLESALALALGVAALVAVLSTAAKPAGVVFAGAIAAYTLGRQLLFPLRDLPRKTSHGRTLTIAVTAAVVLAEALAAVLT
jgi:prolipoprotein diacylglyceryltransferase